MRRLKTYLRNSTSENRLVGSAFLNFHRNIFITDNMVLDKFANSRQAKHLDIRHCDKCYFMIHYIIFYFTV